MRLVSTLIAIVPCLGFYTPNLAAQAPAVLTTHSVVVVPFVGCRSDGQTGPINAPQGKTPALQVSSDAAQGLAWYSSDQGLGILAPRGWHCFGTSGSNGQTLYVTPTPIDEKLVFATDRPKLTGAAIQVSRTFSGTSGRFSVAEVIGRVFPAYATFARSLVVRDEVVQERLDQGPYPADYLRYPSNSVVEFRTPPQSEGLGTHSWLAKTADAIEGVAMLVGPDHDLLAVRLPARTKWLTPLIVRQFELDAAAYR